MNLAEHVLLAGSSRSEKLALAVVGPARAERWSYGRLIAAVRGTATGLLEAGLRPGDRLLMRLGNTPGFPIVYLGAITAGIVPVPTSAMLTTREASKIAAEIGPAMIVAGAGVPMPDHAAPVLDESEMAGFSDLPPADFVHGDPDRLAYIIYTSGSSGQPRAVMHAHRAIHARRLMFDGWYGLRDSDRMMHAGAFNWTFTLGTGLMDPWTLGATALIPAEGTDLDQIPLLASRHGATILAGAPGVFRRILRADWQPFASLRHGLAAGERLDPSLRNEWQARTGTDLHEAMGASELSTFISGSPDRPAPPGTAGFPQPGRNVAILSRDGQPLAAGEAGALAVRRDDPGLFLGYLGQPEESAARFRGDWFLTGDQAVADSDGAITLLGRADDIMNAGGFRVAPSEIEELLATHPQAGDVAVTELAVSPATSIIAAFWTGTASADDLRALAASGLARYKQPRDYIRLEALPRTPTGKINRRALRETHRKDRA
ncbi:class I adenylate-forming enzyme family protein [Paracoccus salsus]|uniref:class I adenylate-forming enzyme family protein n=1 Tax=Paracoccus salsus TaxID=2911061 RepID=UPI001F423488|nr:class I adenylate-forming enzyme family protein [Paracoccus salsus]MCF3973916.1 acyl--CoA ligase [Paracoccus salsus]